MEQLKNIYRLMCEQIDYLELILSQPSTPPDLKKQYKEKLKQLNKIKQQLKKQL